MTEDKSNLERALRNVKQTFSGGEHRLAGARASELIYGGSNKPNESLQERIVKESPGIERYLNPPATGMTEKVGEETGYPLATQPENRPEAIAASNASSEAGKAEQDAVDAATAAGRAKRDEPEATAANPAGSDQETTARDATTSTAKDKAGKK